MILSGGLFQGRNCDHHAGYPDFQAIGAIQRIRQVLELPRIEEDNDVHVA
jgi:hypothetical protein